VKDEDEDEEKKGLCRPRPRFSAGEEMLEPPGKQALIPHEEKTRVKTEPASHPFLAHPIKHNAMTTATRRPAPNAARLR